VLRLVAKLRPVTEIAVGGVFELVSRSVFECIVSSPTVGGEYMILRGQFMLIYLIFFLLLSSFRFLSWPGDRKMKVLSQGCLPDGPSSSAVQLHVLKIRQTRDKNTRHVRTPQGRVDLTESCLILEPELQLAQEMPLSADLYPV
jgi:hypothetical protein